MKKIIVSTFLVSVLAGNAFAQDPSPTAGPPAAESAKKGRLGAGVVLGLPIGDWGNAVNFSIGGLLDFDWALMPAISLTGRAGYIHHLVDADGVSFSTVPIWAGAKYYFGPEGNMRPFAAAELAFNFNRSSVDFSGTSASSSELDLGLNLGGGVELGAISLRAFFAILDLGNAGDTMEIMASASYYFLAL